MYRVTASYRAEGRSSDRAFHMPARVQSAREHQVWCVDATDARVAAVDVEDTLWLAGDVVHVITDGRCESVAWTVGLTPPGHDPAGPTRWARLEPEVGMRVVVIAGAARAPDPSVDDREALLDAMLAAAGEREAAALILDVVAAPVFADLPAWIADVLARQIDLSWIGNEGDPGFVHALRRPFAQTSVRDGLLAHAREDPELRRLIREYAEAWIEDGGESPVEGRLEPDDPTRGWVEDLELDASADALIGTTGAWLDSSKATNARVEARSIGGWLRRLVQRPRGRLTRARRAWSLELPGAAIVAALHEHVEQPTIVAVHSAPSEAVSAVHLLGGIDRASGDLVGFALHRIWT